MFSQPSRWLESNSTLKKITYYPRKHFWWSRDGEWDPGWVKSQDTDPKSGSCIRDEQPESYFLEFRNLIFIHPGSWISGPRSINSNKRVGDKIDITWKNCRTLVCLGDSLSLCNIWPQDIKPSADPLQPAAMHVMPTLPQVLVRKVTFTS